MPGKRLDEMVEEPNDTGAWYPGKLVHDAVEDMENGTYELRSRRRDPQDGERPKSSNQERGEWHRTTCRTTMASRTEGSLRASPSSQESLRRLPWCTCVSVSARHSCAQCCERRPRRILFLAMTCPPSERVLYHRVLCQVATLVPHCAVNAAGCRRLKISGSLLHRLSRPQHGQHASPAGRSHRRPRRRQGGKG